MTKNPFVLFLPFLILYIIIVFIFVTKGSHGDESRYLMYAHNLLHGFYSSPPPDIDLSNGPGYPILLIPFLALHVSLIFITILNAIFYYLSIVFLFEALLKVTSVKIAFIISLFWGFYFNLYEYLPFVLTEVFTVFLVSLLILSLSNAFRISSLRRSLKSIIFSGLIIGYLALTKPIFGYVIISLIIGTAVLLIANWKSKNYRKSILILFISFLTTTPYLLYTHHLTNRLFYWTSNGGNNLYWMSSPYAGEYGSWIQYPLNKIDQSPRIPGSKEIIELNHQKDFDEIFKYKGVEQDDIYKKIVTRNIKSHPMKFFENCFSNVGRIIFNFPRSYELQRPGTLLRLPFNGIIMVLVLFCLLPTVKNWRKIPFLIRFLLFFAILYLGGSVLGSAETRMFTMVVPIFLFWIAYIMQKSIKVTLKFD